MKKWENKKTWKESITFFIEWGLTNILFFLFLILWIYFMYPDFYSFIKNSIEIGTSYEVVKNYTTMINDTDYNLFLQNETINLTNHCEDDICKVWEIIGWLHLYNESLINPMIRGIDPNGIGPCKEVSVAYIILSKLNGMDAKLCFTEKHALVMAKIEDEWMVVDPTNMQVGNITRIRDYLVCKW
ncbi:MAG: hypothetical protein ACE5KD_00930 [Candidatus Bathyarchaeia archaeon]